MNASAIASMEPMSADPRPNYGKAIIAGLVGGLVGTAVKTLGEKIAPPRLPGAESPLGAGIRIISTHFTGHDLDEGSKHMAEMAVHWGFGILTGAVYAAAVEKWPQAKAGYGVAFGLAFWVAAHETLLPLIGWSPTPAQMSVWEQGNECVTHCLYGAAVEGARRALRRKL